MNSNDPTPAAQLPDPRNDKGGELCKTCEGTGIYFRQIRDDCREQIPCPECGLEAFAAERLYKILTRD